MNVALKSPYEKNPQKTNYLERAENPLTHGILIYQYWTMISFVNTRGPRDIVSIEATTDTSSTLTLYI